MKMNKLLVLGALALVGCGSVEGKYTLDKDATKKEAEAEIAKMPAADQEKEKKGLDMIDAMDVSMEIKAGGDATMSFMMKGIMDKPKEETAKWKKDGDDVVITDDKNKETRCSKSGKSLKCTESGGKHKETMVFTKA
jgi:hypothetical protein